MLAELPAWLLPSAAALAALLLTWLWRRWRRLRRMAGKRLLGARGEAKALRLLERAGYRIVSLQAVTTGRLLVDGQEERFQVRADALVRKGRTRYVVEMKGGAEAALISNRHTRRQLREYAQVFSCEAVLLVDAGRGRISEIRFPPA